MAHYPSKNVLYPPEINQWKERINNRMSLSPFSYSVGKRNILQIVLLSLFSVFIFAMHSRVIVIVVIQLMFSELISTLT